MLKPFKDIIAAKVTDLDLGGIVPALEEQVGYKLTALLRLRLEVPVETREILMGDDSEADAVAYLLYHQFTSKQLTTETADGQARRGEGGRRLEGGGRHPGAPGAGGAAGRGPRAWPSTSTRTGKPNARFPVTSWSVPQLTRYHTGAWPLALDLFEEGRVSGPAVNGGEGAPAGAGPDGGRSVGGRPSRGHRRVRARRDGGRVPVKHPRGPSLARSGNPSAPRAGYLMMVPQSTKAKLVSTRKLEAVVCRSAWKRSML